MNPHKWGLHGDRWGILFILLFSGSGCRRENSQVVCKIGQLEITVAEFKDFYTKYPLSSRVDISTRKGRRQLVSAITFDKIFGIKGKATCKELGKLCPPSGKTFSDEEWAKAYRAYLYEEVFKVSESEIANYYEVNKQHYLPLANESSEQSHKRINEGIRSHLQTLQFKEWLRRVQEKMPITTDEQVLMGIKFPAPSS